MKKRYGKRKAAVRPAAGPVKRHTHNTIAGLEDALAVVADIEKEVRLLELRLEHNLTGVEYLGPPVKLVGGRLNDLELILLEVRKSPYKYDIDRPAGLRLVINRRHI